MFNLTCCAGHTGGNIHLPIKEVGQESLTEAMEQNVGLKESNTPVENERLMQTPLYHTWLF